MKRDLSVRFKCSITTKDATKFINLIVSDTLEIDGFCDFNEKNKKEWLMPISEALKYIENSHYSIVDEWNFNNVPIDIDRHKNITMLDILNYQTFMNVSINIK